MTFEEPPVEKIVREPGMRRPRKFLSPDDGFVRPKQEFGMPVWQFDQVVRDEWTLEEHTELILLPYRESRACDLYDVIVVGYVRQDDNTLKIRG
jgi:hypothetical protein